jgi:hypothetical protein
LKLPEPRRKVFPLEKDCRLINANHEGLSTKDLNPRINFKIEKNGR